MREIKILSARALGYEFVPQRYLPEGEGEDYLRNDDNIGVMHNSDDIILGPGDIEYLQEVMGERAKIFPLGGHCGNMHYRENVAYMLDFFKN